MSDYFGGRSLSTHREEDGLVLLGDCSVRGLWLFFFAEVDVDGLGVCVSTVNGVAEVHEEGRALPTQAGLDVRVREVCAVEEVCGRDSDGVGGPELEAWVFLFDVEDKRGGGSEMGGRHGGCDELGLAFGVLEYSEGFVRGSPQADGAEVDAQGGSDGAVVRMAVVAGEIDFLAVVLVLLFPPFHAHVVDVSDGEMEEVFVGEAAFALAQEGEVVPGEGKGWGSGPFTDDGVVGLSCLAPFGGSGAGIASKDDPVGDGGERAVRALGAGFIDEPLDHAISDHVPSVWDTLVVGQGREDDFDIVLFGLEGKVAVS